MLRHKLDQVANLNVSNTDQNVSNVFVEQAMEIQRLLNEDLNKANLLKHPVKYIYNPTEYAWEPYLLYFQKYCQSPKRILFVGMNPGPFGMCQTGVPFGDTNWVKNWLNIEAPVFKPPVECPNRPVQGFTCTRKEQSGDRLWKLLSDICRTPDNFFKNAFVFNYCPLAFMNEKGNNLTPADIKNRKELELICDKYYQKFINLLQPEIVLAIGRYVEERTKNVFNPDNIIYMPHPSPRVPNNQNWAEKTMNLLKQYNLLQFLQ